MISIVGILNCTPDSFSDGDPEISPARLYDYGLKLIDDGADMIDIGGDSTRPGSICVDTDEEWRRIGSIVERLALRIPISVDTHKGEIARRAIDCGARVINDVGAGCDPEMRAVIAASDVSYVFMYSSSGVPHIFSKRLQDLVDVDVINKWIKARAESLQRDGIESSRLIADTGMGAFLGPDPALSEGVVSKYEKVWAPAGGLMFGCSRKGFLKRQGERNLLERDALSCMYGLVVAGKIGPGVPLYLRVHNVALQRAASPTSFITLTR